MRNQMLRGYPIAVLVLVLASGCASTQTAATSESSSNPVLAEMEKILDLKSNPNEEISGQNELATDGTGTMVIEVKKLILLQPLPRQIVMGASGATTPEGVDLSKAPVRARFKMTRPGGRLVAEGVLEFPVTDHAAFLAFLAGKSSSDSYRSALEHAGVSVGADGRPTDAAGKIVDLSVVFPEATRFEIASARLRN